MSGWYGFDLDGTLANDSNLGVFSPYIIGPPIPAIVDLINQHLAEGKTCKIFTARVHLHDPVKKQAMINRIQDYLEKECKLPRLEVTNVKTTSLRALYDDRAFHVIRNTGIILKP
jgi:hypothetical protein